MQWSKETDKREQTMIHYTLHRKLRSRNNNLTTPVKYPVKSHKRGKKNGIDIYASEAYP